MASFPVVYLLHFAQPLGNPNNPRALAAHYVGWAVNLEDRMREHHAGRGAAITRAAVARGVAFEVVQTWPGDYRLEHHIKRLKNAPRLCPHCGQKHPRGPLCLYFVQLELPLFDPFDLPEPATRMDWYELSYIRRANRWQPQIAVDLSRYDTPEIPF